MQEKVFLKEKGGAEETEFVYLVAHVVIHSESLA